MKYLGNLPALLLVPTPPWVEQPQELPAGWDSAAFACDEYNGAGVNEPCSPDLFDAAVIYPPSVIEEADTSVFDGCADYTVRCEPNVITVRHEPNVICIKR